MAAVAVLIMFLAIAGVHLWLRSRRPTEAPQQEASKPLVPMTEPFAPSGVFLDESHVWARLGSDGAMRIGIDAFLAGVLGEVDDVELPPRGKTVRRGEPLFRIQAGGRTLDVPSPMDGEVVRTHGDASTQPWIVTTDPYGVGWAVALRSETAKASLSRLKTGPSATAFLRAELQRWIDFLSRGTQVEGQAVMADGAMPMKGAAKTLSDSAWNEFAQGFVSKSTEA
jgi:glycine cleavage system H protein